MRRMVLAGTGPVTDDGPDPVDERDGSGPSGVRPRASALTPFLGAVTVGLLAAATFRDGAFHPADAMAVGVVSVALIVACLGSGIDRRAWLAVAGLLALVDLVPKRERHSLGLGPYPVSMSQH